MSVITTRQRDLIITLAALVGFTVGAALMLRHHDQLAEAAVLVASYVMLAAVWSAPTALHLVGLVTTGGQFVWRATRPAESPSSTSPDNNVTGTTKERVGVARPGGFEPPTHSLEGCCSIQLS